MGYISLKISLCLNLFYLRWIKNLQYAKDTDIFVLATAFFHQLSEIGLKELWVSFGKGRAKAWYPIHEYAKNIGLQNIKLSFYALSGCDSVSVFKNKGKVITSDMRGIFRHYWHIFKTKKLSSRLRHNWWTSCRKVHIFYFKMWLPMFKLLFYSMCCLGNSFEYPFMLLCLKWNSRTCKSYLILLHRLIQ